MTRLRRLQPIFIGSFLALMTNLVISYAFQMSYFVGALRAVGSLVVGVLADFWIHK